MNARIEIEELKTHLKKITQTEEKTRQELKIPNSRSKNAKTMVAVGVGCGYVSLKGVIRYLLYPYLLGIEEEKINIGVYGQISTIKFENVPKTFNQNYWKLKRIAHHLADVANREKILEIELRDEEKDIKELKRCAECFEIERILHHRLSTLALLKIISFSLQPHNSSIKEREKKLSSCLIYALYHSIIYEDIKEKDTLVVGSQFEAVFRAFRTPLIKYNNKNQLFIHVKRVPYNLPSPHTEWEHLDYSKIDKEKNQIVEMVCKKVEERVEKEEKEERVNITLINEIEEIIRKKVMRPLKQHLKID